MRVIILTRKFEDGSPVSEYTKALAEYLVEKGDEALILAFDDGSHYSIDERVEVRRVPLHYEGESLYSWSMMMNNELKGEARRIFDSEEFDIIHANDWITVPGATALKAYLDRPMVLTLHSTEHERGFQSENSSMISELEWKGCRDADKVLVNNRDTYGSVLHDLDVEELKIDEISPFKDLWQETVLKTYRELVKTEQVRQKN